MRLLLVTVAAAWACQPTPVADTPENEPGWTWSDERVMETVNAVRAGRSLQPDSWPGGARVAVLLSFDVDNETVTGLRYGDATVGRAIPGPVRGTGRAAPRGQPARP